MEQRSVKDDGTVEDTTNEVGLLPFIFVSNHHVSFQLLVLTILKVSHLRHFQQSRCSMPVEPRAADFLMITEITDARPVSVLPVTVDVSPLHLRRGDARKHGVGEHGTAERRAEAAEHDPMSPLPIHPVIDAAAHRPFVGTPCAESTFQKALAHGSSVLAKLVTDDESGAH